jgi:hypothetical protein
MALVTLHGTISLDKTIVSARKHLSAILAPILIRSRGMGVMEAMDTQQIAERELERILGSATSLNIDVKGSTRDSRIRVSGFTTLIITVMSENAFRIREDQGNHSGGVQTRVTSEPPRWGDSDPPSSLDQMRSIAERWLTGEGKLARLPAA